MYVERDLWRSFRAVEVTHSRGAIKIAIEGGAVSIPEELCTVDERACRRHKTEGCYM